MVTDGVVPAGAHPIVTVSDPVVCAEITVADAGALALTVTVCDAGVGANVLPLAVTALAPTVYRPGARSLSVDVLARVWVAAPDALTVTFALAPGGRPAIVTAIAPGCLTPIAG
jgi:hypothetical protein